MSFKLRTHRFHTERVARVRLWGGFRFSAEHWADQFIEETWSALTGNGAGLLIRVNKFLGESSQLN